MPSLQKFQFLILLSVLFYLFAATSSYAQEASFSAFQPAKSEQADDSWLDRLLGRIKEEEIGETLKVYNQSNMPYGVEITPAKAPEVSPKNQAQEETGDAAVDTVGKYMMAASTQTQDQTSTNLLDSLINLLLRTGRIFGIGSVVEVGDKKAIEFAGSQMPLEVVDELSSVGVSNIQGLAAQSNQGEAMGKSVPLLQCAQLPFGVGGCEENSSPRAVPSPTPTVFLSEEPSPTPTLTKQPPFEDAPPVMPTPSQIYLPTSKSGDLACANNPPVSSKLAYQFWRAGSWKGIPAAVLAALGCVEGGYMWALSDSQVELQSREGSVISDCRVNECGAQGPMQMTVGFDKNGNPLCPDCPGAVRLGQCPNQWEVYGDAAKEALGRSSTNACNITDSLYAVSKKVNRDKEIRDQYVQYGSSYAQFCAQATDSWDDPNLIFCITGAFYGQCQPCQQDESGNYTTSDCRRFYHAFGKAMNYCEFTNLFYKQWKHVYDFTISPAEIPTPTFEPTPSNSPSTSSYIYYSQREEPYASFSLPNGCDIKYSGCGPSTVGMILASLVNKTYNPMNVVQQFYPSIGCEGSSIDEARQIIEQFGYQTKYFVTFGHDNPQPVSVVLNDLRNYSQNGWDMVATANFYWQNKGWTGHIFWIVDVDSQGNIWVMDPYFGFGKPFPLSQKQEHRYKYVFGFKK